MLNKTKLRMSDGADVVRSTTVAAICKIKVFHMVDITGYFITSDK
jgi:hypothetical protein